MKAGRVQRRKKKKYWWRRGSRWRKVLCVGQCYVNLLWPSSLFPQQHGSLRNSLGNSSDRCWYLWYWWSFNNDLKLYLTSSTNSRMHCSMTSDPTTIRGQWRCCCPYTLVKMDLSRFTNSNSNLDSDFWRNRSILSLFCLNKVLGMIVDYLKNYKYMNTASENLTSIGSTTTNTYNSLNLSVLVMLYYESLVCENLHPLPIPVFMISGKTTIKQTLCFEPDCISGKDIGQSSKPLMNPSTLNNFKDISFAEPSSEPFLPKFFTSISSFKGKGKLTIDRFIHPDGTQEDEIVIMMMNKINYGYMHFCQSKCRNLNFMTLINSLLYERVAFSKNYDYCHEINSLNNYILNIEKNSMILIYFAYPDKCFNEFVLWMGYFHSSFGLSGRRPTHWRWLTQGSKNCNPKKTTNGIMKNESRIRSPYSGLDWQVSVSLSPSALGISCSSDLIPLTCYLEFGTDLHVKILQGRSTQLAARCNPYTNLGVTNLSPTDCGFTHFSVNGLGE